MKIQQAKIRIYKFINLIFSFNFKLYFLFFRYQILPSFEHKKVLKNLSEVSTFFDVGANKGQFILLADYIFSKCKILAFEPIKTEYYLLKKIFNKKKNIKIYNFALGNKNKIININVSKARDSSSLMYPTKIQLNYFPKTFVTNTSKIKLTKLKNIVSKAGLKKPFFLKIDVQGYELEVLKGSNLKEFKYIYLEGSYVELYQGQPKINSIIKYLRSKKFKLIDRVNCIKNIKNMPVQCDFLFLNLN